MIIRLLEKLTPSRLTETICSIPVIAGCNEEGAEGLWKTISLVLSTFTIMKLSAVQPRTLSNSTEISTSVFSGTSRLVQSHEADLRG